MYIGRGSQWGNPFILGEHGNREEVIQQYEAWIKTQPHMMGALYQLKDKVLGCWCAPKACHGDVLIKLMDQIDWTEE